MYKKITFIENSSFTTWLTRSNMFMPNCHRKFSKCHIFFKYFVNYKDNIPGYKFNQSKFCNKIVSLRYAVQSFNILRKYVVQENLFQG